MTSREFKGAKPRSAEFFLVAYFFARCGHDRPPRQLGLTLWTDAYNAFYRALGGGRTEAGFLNSMKNARDQFDSHLRGARVGWNEGPKNKPRALSRVAADVLKAWEDKADEQLWNAVRNLMSTQRET
jgi:hypothetical protein